VLRATPPLTACPPYVSTPPRRSLWRGSGDDFYPRNLASHAAHITTVSFNSLFLGELGVCDWDMFQSVHECAHLQAAARAVGGGAIYVSDKPGVHDFELLRSLVLPDGSTLRPKHAGRCAWWSLSLPSAPFGRAVTRLRGGATFLVAARKGRVAHSRASHRPFPPSVLACLFASLRSILCVLLPLPSHCVCVPVPAAALACHRARCRPTIDCLFEDVARDGRSTLKVSQLASYKLQALLRPPIP
jgi:hypothetical protein